MESGRTAARYRPSLLLALKRGVGDFYDRLGLSVAASLFLSVPPAMAMLLSQMLVDSHSLFSRAALWLGLLAALLWGPLGLAACMLMARRAAYFEDPGVDIYSDVLKQWRGVLRLGVVQLVVTTVLLADTMFFMSLPSPAALAFGIVVAYCVLVWLMSALWHWPFFWAGERSVLLILKRSLLVALDNPFFTLGVLFVTILASAALWATIFGAVVAMPAALSCFIVRAHREILKKYDLAEDPPDEVADPGWPASERLRRITEPEEPENQPNA